MQPYLPRGVVAPAVHQHMHMLESHVAHPMRQSTQQTPILTPHCNVDEMQITGGALIMGVRLCTEMTENEPLNIQGLWIA